MSQQQVVRATDITFNEGILRIAAIHKKRVRFNYLKGDGKVIEFRYLDPNDVKVINPGEASEHVTVTGFDPIRQAVRHYRLDRIALDVEIVA